jgi:hypothetical protein
MAALQAEKDALASNISRLESSSTESLTMERNVANERVSELVSGSMDTEDIVSSYCSLKRMSLHQPSISLRQKFLELRQRRMRLLLIGGPAQS